VSRRALVVAAVAAGRRLLAGRISGAGSTGRQRAGEWWHLYHYVTGATLLDEPIPLRSDQPRSSTSAGVHAVAGGVVTGLQRAGRPGAGTT
jgi:hypothetical protein